MCANKSTQFILWKIALGHLHLQGTQTSVNCLLHSVLYYFHTNYDHFVLSYCTFCTHTDHMIYINSGIVHVSSCNKLSGFVYSGYFS